MNVAVLGAMVRRELPKRRASSVHDLVVEHVTYRVQVGYFEDGAPGEIFINAPRPDSQIDALAGDGATLASVALQFGLPASLLGASLARLATGPFKPAVLPASAIGAAIDLVARIAAAGPFAGLREDFQ